jgi:hypothetical protein
MPNNLTTAERLAKPMIDFLLSHSVSPKKFLMNISTTIDRLKLHMKSLFQ